MKKTVWPAIAMVLTLSAECLAGAPIPGADFNLDVRDFITKDSVRFLSAAWAPSGNPWLAKAQGMYERLKAAGHVRAEVDFKLVDGPGFDRSPGYADYDYAKGRCSMLLNERLLMESQFKEEFLYAFMVYHELAHCDLFADPREIRPFPSLSPRAARMLSDLLYLEFLQVGSDDGPKANGYGTYQETYADIKAMAVMLAEGRPAEQVAAIMRFRESNPFPFMDTHDTAGALGKVLAHPWRSLGVRELDDTARSMADAYIAGHFLSKSVSPDPYAARPSDILVSKVRTPVVNYRFPYTSAEDRALLEKQLDQAWHSPYPGWKEYSRLVREGLADDAMMEAYFRVRYGAGPAELKEEDEAIRAAMRVISCRAASPSSCGPA